MWLVKSLGAYFLDLLTTLCCVFARYVVVERRWRMLIEGPAVVSRDSASSFHVALY